MCGISGYYKNNSFTDTDLTEAKKSLLTIKHREPDGAGMILINSFTGFYVEVDVEYRPITLNQITKVIEFTSYNTIFGHKTLNY